MTVVYLTNDLMFSSRVSAAAKSVGVAVRFVTTVEQAVEQASTADVRLVILDMNTAGIAPGEAVPRLRSAGRNPLSIIAYAPHVHTHKLDAATSANCDEVLTQGQFNRQIDQILSRYLTPAD